MVSTMSNDNRPRAPLLQDSERGAQAGRSASSRPGAHGIVTKRCCETSEDRRVGPLEHRSGTAHRLAIRYRRSHRTSPGSLARYDRTRVRLQIQSHRRHLDRYGPGPSRRIVELFRTRQRERPRASCTSPPHPRKHHPAPSTSPLGRPRLRAHGTGPVEPKGRGRYAMGRLFSVGGYFTRRPTPERAAGRSAAQPARLQHLNGGCRTLRGSHYPSARWPS